MILYHCWSFFMGAFLSLNIHKASRSQDDDSSRSHPLKRQRVSSTQYDESPRLIPSLPDELSFHILARIPRFYYLNLKLVSRKWNTTITGQELYDLRKDLGKTEEWLYLLTKADEEKLIWHALDPLSRKWQRLPTMPAVGYETESWKSSPRQWMWNMVGPTIKIGEYIRGWLGQKDAWDKTPFCGCSVGALDGCLYVLGGLSGAFTTNRVWRFDPTQNIWEEVQSMSVGRAYCKTGVLNSKLYVVGGVNRGRDGFSPLQSAEVFDPSTKTWSEVPSMPFSRARSLPTAFLVDMLKPIATGLTSYMGRLCVPQSLYAWPFFLDVGGEVFEPETNSWVDMPNGMGEGWPARQAGTKLSVVVDGELYAFDPSTSQDSSKIKVYDQLEDTWKVAIQKIPMCDSSDQEHPSLLAGFHGKLHIITKDSSHRVVILRADLRENDFQSPPSSSIPFRERIVSFSDVDAVIWKLIAERDFGSAELLSCQVLDL